MHHTGRRARFWAAKDNAKKAAAELSKETEKSKKGKSKSERHAGPRQSKCPGNEDAPCVFSRTKSGEPVKSPNNGLCIFCDVRNFPHFADTIKGKKEIKEALRAFDKHNKIAHERAVQMAQTLPTQICNSVLRDKNQCVGGEDGPCRFSQKQPGKPAFVEGGKTTCIWCDKEALRDAEENEKTRRVLQRALNAFERNHQEVHAIESERLTKKCKERLASSKGKSALQKKSAAKAALKRAKRS